MTGCKSYPVIPSLNLSYPACPGIHPHRPGLPGYPTPSARPDRADISGFLQRQRFFVGLVFGLALDLCSKLDGGFQRQLVQQSLMNKLRTTTSNCVERNAKLNDTATTEIYTKGGQSLLQKVGV